MSDMTVFTNNPSTTATGSAGTTTSDTNWPMTDVSSFPVPNASSTPLVVFHIADPALPSEIIEVVAVSSNTWTVERGAEGTTPVAHAAGATYYQVVTAADLTSFKQATGAITAPVTVGPSSNVEKVVCSYQPVAGEVVAGTTFELVATGILRANSTTGLLTWRLVWGALPGTTLLTVVSGTTSPSGVCAVFSTAMSATQGMAFDVNGTVTFVSTTSAVANLNFWFQQNTSNGCGTGVASNGTVVSSLTAPPGGGPLQLTAKWNTSSSIYGLTVPAPIVYRAA